MYGFIIFAYLSCVEFKIPFKNILHPRMLFLDVSFLPACRQDKAFQFTYPAAGFLQAEPGKPIKAEAREGKKC